MAKNTIRELLNALRPNMPTVAGWLDVSVWSAQSWHMGTHAPKPEKRAALVKATRKHAKELLRLADVVEREGRAQHRGK